MTVVGPNRLLRLCVVQLDGIPHAFTEHDDLWIPAEPLIDPARLAKISAGLPELSIQQLFVSENPRIFHDIQECASEAATNHLKEVLFFLAAQEVDIAVFPEYLLPIRSLHDLVEFSHGRAVVAGLEHVRSNERAAQLALASASSGKLNPGDLLQRNISVLVENENVHLITKRYPSDSETAREGTGPIVKNVWIHGRQVRLGVAVCLDYLRLEEDVRKQGPEIVCIPAYTSSLPSFRPDEPRDYVRMLANCAAHGGSRIMMPGLRGPLTDLSGVQPISAGYEALILVEYDRYPQRPTALRRPENHLRLRAEIVELTTLKSAILADIQRLTGVHEPSGPTIAELQEQLPGWLDQIGHEGPLAEALKAYSDSLAQASEDPRLDDLVFTHPMVQPGRGRDAVRLQQAQYVIERLKDLQTSGSQKPVGAAGDAYSRLVAQLAGAAGRSPPAASAPSPLEEKRPAEAETKVAAPAPTARPPAPTDQHPLVEFARPERPGQSRDLPNVVVPIRPDVDIAGDEGPEPLLAKPSSQEMCQALARKSYSLLEGVRALVAYGSADAALVAALQCRYRAAEAAVLLTELAELTRDRADFEWNNAIGAAQRMLTRLRQDLPSGVRSRSAMGRQPDRSSLREVALNLHDATIRLRDLTA